MSLDLRLSLVGWTPADALGALEAVDVEPEADRLVGRLDSDSTAIAVESRLGSNWNIARDVFAIASETTVTVIIDKSDPQAALDAIIQRLPRLVTQASQGLVRFLDVALVVWRNGQITINIDSDMPDNANNRCAQCTATTPSISTRSRRSRRR